jgi:hypothetical protein
MRSWNVFLPFVTPFTALIVGLTALPSLAQSALDYHTDSLTKDEPQPTYSADPSDPWNRIFHALFTRTVRARLTEEFAVSAPSERVRALGFPELAVSTNTFERIESGDRAIEPLDPFPVHKGARHAPQRVFSEPYFTRLKRALTDALREQPSRPPLSRALMQTDLWAAHDVLFATRPPDMVQRGRKDELVGLLARSIKKLSLSSREAESLPDNYASAQLPFDPFAADGGWIEIEFNPERVHEHSADFRRVTRVFLKPSSAPLDREAWLERLRGGLDPTSTPGIAAVALVVQLLVVDSGGSVVPTKLTHEVQFRTFLGRGAGPLSQTKVEVAELSRKALLLDRQAGGLRRFGESAPSYLPTAGNDYFFASTPGGRPEREPILAPLRKRCQSCHGEEINTIRTLLGHLPNPPPVRQLNIADNARAREVSRRKMQREDFRELKRLWDR